MRLSVPIRRLLLAASTLFAAVPIHAQSERILDFHSDVTLEDDCFVLTFKAKGGKAVRKECDAAKLVRRAPRRRAVSCNPRAQASP